MHCGNGHCFPALSVYAKQVEDVKKEIYKIRGITIERVVVTASALFYFLVVLSDSLNDRRRIADVLG